MEKKKKRSVSSSSSSQIQPKMDDELFSAFGGSNVWEAAPLEEQERKIALHKKDVPSQQVYQEDISEEKSPGILTNPPEYYLKKIKGFLAEYVEDSTLLSGFQAMKEWDLATEGKLSETDILQAYTDATDLPIVDEEELDTVDRFSDVTYEFLQHWLCLPISWDAKNVVIVVAVPYSIESIAYLWSHLLGKRALFCLGQRSYIERKIEAVYSNLDGEVADAFDLDAGDGSEEALRDLASEAPIVRLVNDMFARAIDMVASDIHIEPSENSLAIRFRIDGVLQIIMEPPIATYPAIASRIKLIGGLNIAERRLPQDGRTDLHIGRAHIDIRISTLPAIHGESIVLRLLRKDVESFTLQHIGMDKNLQDPFTDMVHLPFGIILVVGPTGSGKSTTLYCAMNLIDTAAKKVITAEDPVEYQMEGVTQIQVRSSIGLTFAKCLRSIVRQDPDIILVGEIRDKETAEIAVHAALTGHLVLSTLHTNDATGAISRLIDMGVEPFLLASSLIGVLSQRLVRRLCSFCQGKGVVGVGKGDIRSKEEVGVRNCRNCSGSGFKGRIGIFEFLKIDDDIRRATIEKADNSILNAIAQKNGMKPLVESGEEKIQAGITTPAEIARVCQLEVT